MFFLYYNILCFAFLFDSVPFNRQPQSPNASFDNSTPTESSRLVSSLGVAFSSLPQFGQRRKRTADNAAKGLEFRASATNSAARQTFPTASISDSDSSGKVQVQNDFTLEQLLNKINQTHKQQKRRAFAAKFIKGKN